MKEQIGVMLSSSEVENRISEMAAAIDKAYEGKTIHLIGILKGSVFFMCELAKRMKESGHHGLHVCEQLWRWNKVIRYCQAEQGP